MRFAQRVQAALLPTELPKRLKGVDVAARVRAGARARRRPLRLPRRPSRTALVVAVGDVSGKGVPAALYSAFAGELVRGRARSGAATRPSASVPAGVLASMNTILHERQLEEYYCTLCYAVFDFKRRTVTLANSGLPYPVRCTRRRACAQIELPGVPLGSFSGIDLRRGARSPLGAGRRVRVLLGRRVRGHERARGGIHGGAAADGDRGRPRRFPPARSCTPSSTPSPSIAPARRRTTTRPSWQSRSAGRP